MDARPDGVGSSSPSSLPSPGAASCTAPRSCSWAARGRMRSRRRVSRGAVGRDQESGRWRRALPPSGAASAAGEFEAAEEAYREASRFGWEPQPGLAQLRLAQGKTEAALAAIRRANAEVAEPLKRAALLPAHVEIALAAGEIEEARTACLELRELAERYESAMLEPSSRMREGAVALAEGTRRGARPIAPRSALWLELDAPYEVARTRELIAQGVLGARRRGGGMLELEAARETFAGWGPRPIWRASRPGQARATACRSASSRCCGSSRRGRATARSPRRSSSASTRWRGTCRTSTRSSASPRARAATAFAFEHELV